MSEELKEITRLCEIIKDKDKEIERLEKRSKEIYEGFMATQEELKEYAEENERLNNIIKEAKEYIENNDLYEQNEDYDYEENLILGVPSDEKPRKILLEILEKSDKE